MKFIGNLEHKFNIQLVPLIYNINFTVVSCIDGNFTYDSHDDTIIQLLPIHDDINYYKTVDKAYSKMVKNGLFESNKRCTSILIVQPDLVDVEAISTIILNLDVENLVDTIWVYPEPTNLVVRNNDVSKLPYQTKVNQSRNH